MVFPAQRVNLPLSAAMESAQPPVQRDMNRQQTVLSANYARLHSLERPDHAQDVKMVLSQIRHARRVSHAVVIQQAYLGTFSHSRWRTALTQLSQTLYYLRRWLRVRYLIFTSSLLILCVHRPNAAGTECIRCTGNTISTSGSCSTTCPVNRIANWDHTVCITCSSEDACDICPDDAHFDSLKATCICEAENSIYSASSSTCVCASGFVSSGSSSSGQCTVLFPSSCS